MAAFSTDTWMLIFVFIAIAVISFAYVLASSVGEAKKVHELRLRVVELRKTYAQRLKALYGENGPPEIAELSEDQSLPGDEPEENPPVTVAEVAETPAEAEVTEVVPEPVKAAA